MNSTETTENLLATRNQLSEILERHGKLPNEWLVSAEQLQAPYEDRVHRLYTELTTNVDYIGQMARNVAQLPTLERAIRTYGPSAQEQQLLEDLSSVSSFHKIKCKAAIASARNNASIHQVSMSIRYTPELIHGGPYNYMPGIKSSDGNIATSEELDEAVSSYFTFFRPYPPLQRGWIPGIIRRLIVDDWQTDYMYITWTWVALSWAEAASRRLQLHPAWPLDSEDIQNRFREFLYRPVEMEVYYGPVRREYWGPSVSDTENEETNEHP